MRILMAVVFPMLALACGAPAASATSESSETEPSTTETSTGDTTEAEGDSPPQCVAMGQPCENDAYCCYGSCRAEDGDPQLLCRP